MISLEKWNETVALLRQASRLLHEGENLTDIGLMAAFRRGISETPVVSVSDDERADAQ